MREITGGRIGRSYASEDPAAQVLWDLQSDGAMSYRELQAALVRVYGSEGQVEVYRAQLKLVRRGRGIIN